MFNDNICIMNNIAIVQSQGVFGELPPVITVNDLSEYYGTVTLSVVDSMPVVEVESSVLELLFGSWIESGDEDAQLDALYRSRAIPSINSPHE
ncbi:MAG TPA: hypothetical protein DHU69_04405 [Deltaproteobacteria bacterium]|nr:MAG: hypothetical protein A2W74_05280 [Planctomycetes bacterium RIFCSPLOWO2_12_38_17]OHC01359.1 MAG: hypothetical protein A2Z57_02980 [Planctomycetes bacterium RIFCSPHIGHO2_12_39_6]OHC05871.1 MAG: hypothetical protein A3J92_03580 [Planctomycetes bacterium RIFOXYC2_FULL_41_27]OHC07837.1 MAG: hypothetical protein A2545_00440 [Planctomycetes bacterium RIFOXYD2_FULL_41_16]HCY19001.1 hypothetical protein [Deltaproteobacteria bacterium]